MITATPDLEKLRALAEASTPGPWHHDNDVLWSMVTLRPNGFGDFICSTHRVGAGARDDAAFIAAARTAVPWLLDRVDELERELADEREASRESMARRPVFDQLEEVGKGLLGVHESMLDAAQRENAIMRKALEQAVSSPDLGALYGIVRAGVRDDAFGQGAREALKALGNIVAEYSKAAREALSSCSPAPAAEGHATDGKGQPRSGVPDNAAHTAPAGRRDLPSGAGTLQADPSPSPPPACERCGRLETALRDAADHLDSAAYHDERWHMGKARDARQALASPAPAPPETP